MFLQFRLNPAQMDPTQQQIFAIMPWMMMFIMAPFAAGLLVYWITSNILTLAQQKWLYSRHPALRETAKADLSILAAKEDIEGVEGARKIFAGPKALHRKGGVEGTRGCGRV